MAIGRRAAMPRTAGAYVALMRLADLAWKAAHGRLSTQWAEASPGEAAHAFLRFTAGDGVWLAVEVWGRWADAPAMSRQPPPGMGFTPLRQGEVLPPLVLFAARRVTASPGRGDGGLP
jgi:hypothetical protein